jgi:hypothetical protein
MAKAITPDLIETIVTRVMEKFTDVLTVITNNLSAVIRDTFNAQLAILNARLDAIEGKIALNSTAGGYRGDVVYDTSHPSGSLPNELSATVIEGLLNYEKEKEEIRRRSRNVIITGLPRQHDTSDFELVESFCENHLTVKPHIVNAKRVGRDTHDHHAKLCVTLESPETVDDIISSATILRTSTDPAVKRVYFNRDLTKQQADAAYQRRLEKRSKKTQPVSAAAAAGLQAPGGHIATTTANENSFQSGSI